MQVQWQVRRRRYFLREGKGCVDRYNCQFHRREQMSSSSRLSTSLMVPGVCGGWPDKFGVGDHDVVMNPLIDCNWLPQTRYAGGVARKQAFRYQLLDHAPTRYPGQKIVQVKEISDPNHNPNPVTNVISLIWDTRSVHQAWARIEWLAIMRDRSSELILELGDVFLECCNWTQIAEKRCWCSLVSLIEAEEDWKHLH